MGESGAGGFRVGVVTDMQPVMLPNHKVGARLTLKLDKKAGQTNGEDQLAFGARWYAVSGKGTAVVKASPPPTNTTTTTPYPANPYP